MATQDTPILIVYNDDTNSKTHPKEDFETANKLKQYLQTQKKPSEIIGLSKIPPANSSYQWLIVVNPEAGRAEQKRSLDAHVQTILQQVIERKKRGVLAVTTGSLSQDGVWRTIRQYDISDAENNDKIEKEAFDGIAHATQYAKLPLSQTQQANRVNNALSTVKNAWQKPLVAVIVVILLVLLLGTGLVYGLNLTRNPFGFGFFFQTPAKSITPTTGLDRKQIDATATQTAKDATQTAKAATQTATTSQPTLTPDTSSPQAKLYANATQGTPTITGFRMKDNWNTNYPDTKGNPLCFFDNPAHPKAYHAVSEQTDSYTRCMAQATNFKNFVYQVTMTITTGFAGGVIFRDDGKGTFYRFSLANSGPNQQYEYKVIFCNTTDFCYDMVTKGNELTSGIISDNSLTPGQPITLTVIAQDNKIYFYVNGKYLDYVTPSSSLGATTQLGQVGVYAASSQGNIPTEITFSNLKVWDLGNS